MKTTLKALGDWNKQLEVPLSNALVATTELTGMSGYRACRMGLVVMAKSASRHTKKSKKKIRTIVEDPDKRWKTDKRYAPLGVMKYDRNGKEYFKPLKGTGEYGKLRYLDRRTLGVFDRSSGKWVKIASGVDPANPEVLVPGIKTDKRRIIRNHGLAKRSWFWGINGLKGAPKAKGRYIPGVSTRREIRSDKESGFILTNRLRYIYSAAPRNVTDIAARKASNSIMFNAARTMEKKFGVTIDRYAHIKAKKAQKTLKRTFKEGR